MKNAAKRDRPEEPHVEGSTKEAKMGEGDYPMRAVGSKKVVRRKVDYVHAKNDVRLDAWEKKVDPLMEVYTKVTPYAADSDWNE